MASFTAPRIYTYKATAAVAKGKAVKIGASRDTVAVASATTDRCIGLVQNGDVTAAGDNVEVAIQGGGGLGLLAGTVAAGNDLTANASGALIKVATTGDEIIARAMEAGVSGDLISVEVLNGSKTNAAQ